MSKIPEALSSGEETFALHYHAKLHPVHWPEREYRFHPPHKWKFDFAFLQYKIAVEIEGGVWVAGRHNRPLGFISDMEKYNTAVKDGWKVLRYSTDMVLAGDAINDVLEMLNGQG